MSQVQVVSAMYRQVVQAVRLLLDTQTVAVVAVAVAVVMMALLEITDKMVAVPTGGAGGAATPGGGAGGMGGTAGGVGPGQDGFFPGGGGGGCAFGTSEGSAGADGSLIISW